MALPLIGSGYFNTLADANFDVATNINRRNLAFGQFLTDLGLRRNRGGQIIVDRNNPDGAFQEGARATAYGAADRGFSTGGEMRRIAFQPIRNEITRKARREQANMVFENQADKLARRRMLAQASQDAARYGYENKQPQAGR